MWLFINEVGFLSVIEREGQPDQLVVRARDAADLQRLKKLYLPTLSATETTLDRDYGWRAVCTKEGFGAAVAAAVMDVRYFNFKASTEKTLGRFRARVYHAVWSALLRLQRP